MSCAVMHQLKDDIKTVFHHGKYHSKQIHQVTKLSNKLDAFAKLLNLTPYDHRGKFKGRLASICKIRKWWNNRPRQRTFMFKVLSTI